MIRAKEHLTHEGLAKIKELHAQMNSKRDRSNIDHGIIGISNDWLRGFVDAEGSFYASVTPNKTSALGYRVVATFAISQTASEKPVLEAIQSFLGCGFIRTPNIPGRLPVCEFQVNAFKDILNVVLPFFNANPPWSWTVPRPGLLTTKRLNYLDFEAIMRLVERKKHLSQSGLDQIRTIIAGMNRKREYPNFFLGA